MHELERNKLIELTKSAVAINEKLLSDEKLFIEAISTNIDSLELAEMNERLNDLCTQEHLYLAATKSLLQIINKE